MDFDPRNYKETVGSDEIIMFQISQDSDSGDFEGFNNHISKSQDLDSTLARSASLGDRDISTEENRTKQSGKQAKDTQEGEEEEEKEEEEPVGCFKKLALWKKILLVALPILLLLLLIVVPAVCVKPKILKEAPSSYDRRVSVHQESDLNGSQISLPNRLPQFDIPGLETLQEKHKSCRMWIKYDEEEDFGLLEKLTNNKLVYWEGEVTFTFVAICDGISFGFDSCQHTFRTQTVSIYINKTVYVGVATQIAFVMNVITSPVKKLVGLGEGPTTGISNNFIMFEPDNTPMCIEDCQFQVTMKRENEYRVVAEDDKGALLGLRYFEAKYMKGPDGVGACFISGFVYVSKDVLERYCNTLDDILLGKEIVEANSDVFEVIQKANQVEVETGGVFDKGGDESVTYENTLVKSPPITDGTITIPEDVQIIWSGSIIGDNSDDSITNIVIGPDVVEIMDGAFDNAGNVVVSLGGMEQKFTTRIGGKDVELGNWIRPENLNTNNGEAEIDFDVVFLRQGVAVDLFGGRAKVCSTSGQGLEPIGVLSLECGSHRFSVVACLESKGTWIQIGGVEDITVLLDFCPPIYKWTEHNTFQASDTKSGLGAIKLSTCRSCQPGLSDAILDYRLSKRGTAPLIDKETHISCYEEGRCWVATVNPIRLLVILSDILGNCVEEEEEFREVTAFGESGVNEDGRLSYVTINGTGPRGVVDVVVTPAEGRWNCSTKETCERLKCVPDLESRTTQCTLPGVITDTPSLITVVANVSGVVIQQSLCTSQQSTPVPEITARIETHILDEGQTVLAGTEIVFEVSGIAKCEDISINIQSDNGLDGGVSKLIEPDVIEADSLVCSLEGGHVLIKTHPKENQVGLLKLTVKYTCVPGASNEYPTFNLNVIRRPTIGAVLVGSGGDVEGVEITAVFAGETFKFLSNDAPEGSTLFVTWHGRDDESSKVVCEQYMSAGLPTSCLVNTDGTMAGKYVASLVFREIALTPISKEVKQVRVSDLVTCPTKSVCGISGSLDVNKLDGITFCIGEEEFEAATEFSFNSIAFSYRPDENKITFNVEPVTNMSITTSFTLFLGRKDIETKVRACDVLMTKATPHISVNGTGSFGLFEDHYVTTLPTELEYKIEYFLEGWSAGIEISSEMHHTLSEWNQAVPAPTCGQISQTNQLVCKFIPLELGTVTLAVDTGVCGSVRSPTVEVVNPAPLIHITNNQALLEKEFLFDVSGLVPDGYVSFYLGEAQPQTVCTKSADRIDCLNKASDSLIVSGVVGANDTFKIEAKGIEYLVVTIEASNGVHSTSTAQLQFFTYPPVIGSDCGPEIGGTELPFVFSVTDLIPTGEIEIDIQGCKASYPSTSVETTDDKCRMDCVAESDNVGCRVYLLALTEGEIKLTIKATNIATTSVTAEYNLTYKSGGISPLIQERSTRTLSKGGFLFSVLHLDDNGTVEVELTSTNTSGFSCVWKQVSGQQCTIGELVVECEYNALSSRADCRMFVTGETTLNIFGTKIVGCNPDSNIACGEQYVELTYHKELVVVLTGGRTPSTGSDYDLIVKVKDIVGVEIINLPYEKSIEFGYCGITKMVDKKLGVVSDEYLDIQCVFDSLRHTTDCAVRVLECDKSGSMTLSVDVGGMVTKKVQVEDLVSNTPYIKAYIDDVEVTGPVSQGVEVLLEIYNFREAPSINVKYGGVSYGIGNRVGISFNTPASKNQDGLWSCPVTVNSGFPETAVLLVEAVNEYGFSQVILVVLGVDVDVMPPSIVANQGTIGGSSKPYVFNVLDMKPDGIITVTIGSETLVFNETSQSGKIESVHFIMTCAYGLDSSMCLLSVKDEVDLQGANLTITASHAGIAASKTVSLMSIVFVVKPPVINAQQFGEFDGFVFTVSDLKGTPSVTLMVKGETAGTCKSGVTMYCNEPLEFKMSCKIEVVGCGADYVDIQINAQNTNENESVVSTVSTADVHLVPKAAAGAPTINAENSGKVGVEYIFSVAGLSEDGWVVGFGREKIGNIGSVTLGEANAFDFTVVSGSYKVVDGEGVEFKVTVPNSVAFNMSLFLTACNKTEGSETGLCAVPVVVLFEFTPPIGCPVINSESVSSVGMQYTFNVTNLINTGEVTIENLSVQSNKLSCSPLACDMSIPTANVYPIEKSYTGSTMIYKLYTFSKTPFSLLLSARNGELYGESKKVDFIINSSQGKGYITLTSENDNYVVRGDNEFVIKLIDNGFDHLDFYLDDKKGTVPKSGGGEGKLGVLSYVCVQNNKECTFNPQSITQTVFIRIVALTKSDVVLDAIVVTIQPVTRQ